MPFEAVLLQTVDPPIYQRVATQAARLRQLGLSFARIAKSLGLSDKTVVKAVRWRRKHTSSRELGSFRESKS